jgi:AcrR family transcriptional regulator
VAHSGQDELLDAAAHLVVEDGFDAVSIPRIANEAHVSEDQVLAHFGSLEDLLVSMLNREFIALWTELLDDIERDPRGGLLSRIYRYTLPATYERPLVRALYLADRDGLNTIMRSTHGFSYVPQVGLRGEFIRRMQEVGMVRADVDADNLSAVMAAVSAGAALTAPHDQLDDVNEGLFELLVRAVDADVDDTSPGKAAFVEYALSLARPDGRH